MNEIEKFFDSIASSWDENECHSEDEKRFLLDQIGINKGDKIIDIACGTGVISELLFNYSNSDILGIDISKNMIDIAKKKYAGNEKITFLHKDLFELSDDNLFDVAVIYNAYPHFLNPSDLSIKLSKLLKKDGKCAIIHSLSRNELSAHHSGSANKVSRDLLEPAKEFNYFKDQFSLLKADEGKHYFILILMKK